MRKCVFSSLLILPFFCFAQKVEHLILITTDGLRWQEVFRGMDSAIANQARFHQDDSAYIYEQYWAKTEDGRRRKLMPFIWNELVAGGQIYGNRDYGNLVNNRNPYWFSYPGYSEILTGFADTSIKSNDHPANSLVTFLEYFHARSAYKGKVAAFGAWNAFDRIINEKRSGIPVINAFDSTGERGKTANETLINRMLKDSYKPWLKGECLDVFTHYAAMEWLQTRRPRILYIAYGETDEWAHSGMYRSYLDATKQVDQWIADIWHYIQSSPVYRNKTALFITTDHGRGLQSDWTKHNNKVAHSNEIWFAVIGPSVTRRGEIRLPGQWFQDQFAQTISRLLGQEFKPKHPVAKEVKEVFER